jgi:ankyrin repeat protein
MKLRESLICLEYERTPLYFACMHGQADLVTRLLEAGADITIQDTVSDLSLS